MTHLVLFTTNYPFTFTGGETMFIAPELPHLLREFEAVRVVPLHDQGDLLPLPPGLVLDRSLAQRWRRRVGHLLAAPLWPGFWREAWRGLRQGGWVGIARVWRWAAVANACQAWFEAEAPRDGSVLFYTYWRGGATLAAARWSASHPGAKAVTRVHGYDLYAEAFDPPFAPWVAVYRRLSRVIAISQHGADYMRHQGVAAAGILLSRLGVAAAARRNSASTDGVLRIVSCGNVIELKRTECIARALMAFARRHAEVQLDWTHFGDGDRMAALRLALRDAPANLRTVLAGRVPNAAVLAHYASEPVDLFVLLSRSEGLPVSIQEALAAGIPVLATDVGGVAEAVDRSGDNGALLDAEAPLEAVTDALARLLLEPAPERRAARREAAWRRWRDDFDAERNHAQLAARLRALTDDDDEPEP